MIHNPPFKGSVTYGGGGGGVGACDVSQQKIMENFGSLLKMFNILKSSIQSIQNQAFS